MKTKLCLHEYLLLVLFIVVAVVIIVKVGVTIPYFFLGFLLYIQVRL